jgi:hypothetical protein
MNWTMPYPWRSRSDSVRRINMSSEPGNESFFCALRPIPRILSLHRRDYASQVRDVDPARQPGLLTREAASGSPVNISGSWRPAAIRRYRQWARYLYLRDVSVIDQAGRALLSRLAARGIRLLANGVYTSHLVQDLSPAGDEAPRGGSLKREGLVGPNRATRSADPEPAQQCDERAVNPQWFFLRRLSDQTFAYYGLPNRRRGFIIRWGQYPASGYQHRNGLPHPPPLVRPHGLRLHRPHRAERCGPDPRTF